MMKWFSKIKSNLLSEACKANDVSGDGPHQIVEADRGKHLEQLRFANDNRRFVVSHRFRRDVVTLQNGDHAFAVSSDFDAGRLVVIAQCHCWKNIICTKIGNECVCLKYLRKFPSTCVVA